MVKAAYTFVELLQEGAIKENINTLFMGFTEEEAVSVCEYLFDTVCPISMSLIPMQR